MTIFDHVHQNSRPLQERLKNGKCPLICELDYYNGDLLTYVEYYTQADVDAIARHIITCHICQKVLDQFMDGSVRAQWYE